jgi:hypothetical protein
MALEIRCRATEQPSRFAPMITQEIQFFGGHSLSVARILKNAHHFILAGRTERSGLTVRLRGTRPFRVILGKVPAFVLALHPISLPSALNDSLQPRISGGRMTQSGPGPARQKHDRR